MRAEGRRVVDFEAVRRRLGGRCFICELVAGNPEFGHHVVYEDDFTIAFLNAYPILRGYVLVAPRAHREQVTSDFTLDEYLGLQATVYRVCEAVRQVVSTARIYVLSLGSQQGNAHVHWHVAPIPPGIPFHEQQFAALDRTDVIDLDAADMEDLATRIRSALG